MNLYRIWQDVNGGYDTYSDAIVAAESEDEARRIHPHNDRGQECPRVVADDGDWFWMYAANRFEDDTWANVKDVRVRQIGVALPAIERGVICASFHAG